MSPQKSEYRDDTGALPASQKFLRRRQLLVLTVAMNELAPAPQPWQSQRVRQSRDESPDNYTLPSLPCQAHKTMTPSITLYNSFICFMPVYIITATKHNKKRSQKWLGKYLFRPMSATKSNNQKLGL